jgi:8-oxo-dGTP diphosphatase
MATEDSNQVAVAVITCDLGVLVGRRRDQQPPWTFPGGKVLAGEDPDTAAGRETVEETGLAVVTHGELGRRLHPTTGRDIIYIACTVRDGNAAFEVRADGRELSMVAWMRWEELMAVMPDMFAPVRDFIADRLLARRR